MKTNKVLKRMLTVLLSAVVFVCSTPAMAPAMELEAEDILLADAIIEETVSENSIVEEIDVLDGIVSEDTVPVNSVSEDAVQSDADEPLLDEPGEEYVTPNGSLNVGEDFYLAFLTHGGSYNSTPDGYEFLDYGKNETYYIMEEPIVFSSKDDTITMLPEPDNHDGLFVGWMGLMDANYWVANSVVPISALTDVFFGGGITILRQLTETIISTMILMAVKSRAPLRTMARFSAYTAIRKILAMFAKKEDI